MSLIPGVDSVGLLGGGVIGGGWAARFLLNGVDVQLYDPSPSAERQVGEVLANARRAYGKLTQGQLPLEGRLTVVATPEEAVRGVDFVQESAPERLELKQTLLALADAAADPGVVFSSSTSGLLPSRLQETMTHPERLVVGHPFNPVYLLPLVEVCGGTATAPATVQRAADVYRSVGMRPLVLSTEIDGFVADRLLEALWREALWLVNDGVATTAEIDDAIRFGAGLRWSFMGTFLTYRIAGGEAGMRHFMAQFGPTLQWPWTKLMDVPELTEELLDRIVEQSDQQAAGRSQRELEVMRDDCLVAVMQGLRGTGVGAGEVLDEYQRLLYERSPKPAGSAGQDLDLTGPLRIYERDVPADWIDYNGHTNDSRYLQLSSEASDAFFAWLGVDAAYLARGGSFYTVESHVSYVEQSRVGDRLYVTLQVLDHDPKRLHVFTSMYRADPTDTDPTGEGDDVLVATAEHFFLHVDTAAAKAAPAEPGLLARLETVAVHHRGLARPLRAGRRVGER